MKGRRCPPRRTSFSPIWIVSASPTRASAIRRCSRSRKRATLRGEIPGGHTKNLFLRDKKGAPFLVVALEDAAIELKSLHRLLGASGRFSFGSADLMRELLGVEPGSVTPFAVINDKDLPRHRRARRRHDGARGAQLSSAAQYRHDDDFARTGLLRFLEATGHKPRIEPVAAAAALKTAIAFALFLPI